jgi:ParB family chromosome partitioning protein
VSALATVPRGKRTSPPIEVVPDPGVRLEHLPLSVIDVGENVRVDPGELAELVASIAEVGVLSPVKAVGPNAAGRYRLVYGQRRYLASSQLGLTHIPALVEASSEADAKGPRRSIEQLVENLQRKDLNPVEEAVALRDVLAADPKLTQVELAKRLGRSAPWLSNSLRLLGLVASVQDRLRTGELTAAHAKAIASLDLDLQADIADRVVEHGYSAHETERQAKWAKQTAKETRARKAATEKHVKAAIEMLEKVANRKRSTIGVSDYGGGDASKLLKADGWKVIDGWSVAAINQAGECGCAGVWRVQIPYNASGKVELHPACNSKEHADARRAAQEAEWKARNADAAAKRDEEAAAAKRRADGLQAFLERELATPFGQRLILYGLAQDGNDDNLIDRYWDGERQAIYDLDDGAWTLVEKVPDDELAAAVAGTIAEILTGWSVGPGVAAAIDAKMSEAAPDPDADPAPAKKLRKPHTAGGADAPPFTPAQADAARAELGLDGKD